MVVKQWQTLLQKYLSTVSVDISPAVLGALLFRSTKSSHDLLSEWDSYVDKGLSFVHKVSTEKQEELFQHVLIPFEFMCLNPRVSFQDLFVFDEKYEATDNYIMEYIPEISQVLPVYDVPEHSDRANDFIQRHLFNCLKTLYTDKVFVISGKQYVTLNLLEVLSDNKAEFWALLDDAVVHTPAAIDLSTDTYSMRVVYKTKDYATFLLNARRSVIKDFDLFDSSFCTRIVSGNERSLNRRTKASDEYMYLITVLNPSSMLRRMKLLLAESETLSILESLKK